MKEKKTNINLLKEINRYYLKEKKIINLLYCSLIIQQVLQ